MSQLTYTSISFKKGKFNSSCSLLFNSGQPLPYVEYTETENSTWTAVYNMVLDLMPKHACAEYCRVFKLLKDEGVFQPDRIPQLEEMSSFMKRKFIFIIILSFIYASLLFCQTSFYNKSKSYLTF